MNYLAHARRSMLAGAAGAYDLAGVATPDWLGVAARRTKCRTRHAAPHVDSADRELAAFARGVRRHHADDAWFHDSPAFGRLSLRFAKRIRERLGESTSMRPWFLGHVLVELLLDAELAAREPWLLDDYYRRLDDLDPRRVAEMTASMTDGDVGRLAEFVERYREVQFLRDYGDDQRLTFRLSQVMQRVGLPLLGEDCLPVLPACRSDVAACFWDLLGVDALSGETGAPRSA